MGGRVLNLNLLQKNLAGAQQGILNLNLLHKNLAAAQQGMRNGMNRLGIPK